MNTQNQSVQNSGQIKPITRNQLFIKTRKHFGLPIPFKPLVHIALSYVGQWEIINYQGDALGVTPDQKTFMLELIKQHGGFKGGAL